jgi:DNA-binding FadR family transcriptional regulator
VIKNVHGNTVDLLGEAIVAGRYAAGASLPSESVLGEELGVSRTVVRESVKSLIAKGLVTTGPKVGTRVQASENWNWFDPDVTVWQVRAGLTPEFLRDLQDLRRIVEPGAVRLAAERATADDVAVLESAYAGMVEAVQEGGDYMAHDLRFHQALLGACHNRMLIQMNKALKALLRTSFELSTRRKDGPRLSLPLHHDVLNAVAAHKPDRAERAILAIIDGARRDIDLVLASRRRLPPLRHPARKLNARGA